MPPSIPHSSLPASVRYMFGTALLAVVYFFASKLGFTMAFAAEQVTVVWPPTGIAITAVLLWGTRMWPGIALGAFLANITTNEPFFTASMIAAGNTLEALVCVWLLQRFTQFTFAFESIKDVLSFAGTAMLSTVIAATIGVVSLCLGGLQPWDAFGSLWLIWWLGDVAGALIVAPALLVWGHKPYNYSTTSMAEGITLVVGLILTCIVVFAEPAIIGIAGHGFVYLVFPFIIWAALRFNQRGTAFVTLLASAIAIWATWNGLGPFTGASVNQNLMMLQAFMAIVATTGLLLSASVADRKNADLAQRQLAAIVTSSGDAIISITLDGVITSWNKSAERIYGYTSEEAIGQHITLIIPSDHWDEEKDILRKLAEGKTIEHFETVRISKAGHLVPISLTISPLRDEEGNVIGASKVGRDITQQKITQEKIEAAYRAKSEFLANMSHEIRTPMNAVVGLSHILSKSSSLTEKQREIVDTLQLSARSLLSLINDLLDVAKIESNRMDLDYTPFSFSALIDEICNMFSEQAKKKNIVLEYLSTPDDKKQFLGDPLRIRQILTNLISNAIKFTHKGGVTIRFSTSPSSPPQHVYAHVSVQDTGVGIAPEKHAIIFDKFTQADMSITREYGGSGLGLAISKHLAELMGGSITLKSVPGEGAEFTLHIPLEYADVQDAPAVREDSLKSISPAEKKLSVLLVEDHQPNILVATTLLEEMGYRCDVARNGYEALQKVRQSAQGYDAILMDVQMPEMDGYTTTRLLREEEKKTGKGRCPIIGVTAHVFASDIEKCLQSGMDDIITKPFKPEELGQKIASHEPQHFFCGVIPQCITT